MKFLMFVVAGGSAPADADQPGYTIEEWLAETERRGVRLEGDRLLGIGDATTVRESGRLVTDGPFADTKEWIAGFDLIEVDNLDEAIEIASKHPMARFGRVEVRPVWPFE